MSLRCIRALLLLALPGAIVPANGAPSVSADLVDGRLRLSVDRDGGSTVMLDGVGFTAVNDQGVGFGTESATLAEDGQVLFALSGPDAKDATVTATFAHLPRGFSLDWTIKYGGPERNWNPWTTGFSFGLTQPVTGAKAQPVTKWVQPTGAHPWEVAGDTPYPDMECQLREVLFGPMALVILSSTYDADWIYGNDAERVRFSRFPLSKETPCELHSKMTFLAVPADDLDPARLSAEAAGRPVSLQMQSGRVGNLFAPGEPLALDCTVSNVTEAEQACTLELQAWSYQGKRLLNSSTDLALEPRDRRTLRKEFTCRDRGVAFVAARLAWLGGETIQRTTMGVLPERTGGETKPASPFAMGAIIANPQAYPDQLDLPTVLGQMERIGVRWIRSGWFPLKSEITDDDERNARGKAELLRQHGMLPYQQTAPPDASDPEALRRVLETSFARFGWVSPCIEVGNELNFGMKAAECVEKVLRPVSEAQRKVAPECRVLSMGLGGVTQDWLKDFVAAGGFGLIDALSIHPGSSPRAPEFWEGWRGWVFRSQVLDAARACRENGGKDLWITEAYAPTNPDRTGLDLRTSADYLVRTYVCAIALDVKLTAWYQFQDGTWFAQRPNPADIEHNFGVVYTDLSPKPAYVAFAAMTEQLEGAKCLGRLDLGADDLYGVRFERDGEVVDVVWSYRERHETDIAWWPPEQFKDDSRKPGEPWVERWKAPVEVELPAEGAVSVTDIMGNERALRSEDGTVRLQLTGSPVYVRGLGEVSRLPRMWEDIPEGTS